MEGTAKRDHSFRVPAIAAFAPAIAAFALVTVLCCLYAGRPLWLHPQPVQLIRCAAGEGSPCFPDPGLQRLGIPQPLPFEAPQADPPHFGPAR